jgi:hypothetical protein
MFRRRATRNSPRVERSRAPDPLEEWVLSLPWVVERPTDARWPDVRFFEVDCQPLRRHRVWLVTGLAEQTQPGDAGGAAPAAVMPDHPSRVGQPAGRDAHKRMPVPAGHVLVTLSGPAAHQRDVVEAFVLTAYNRAMA